MRQAQLSVILVAHVGAPMVNSSPIQESPVSDGGVDRHLGSAPSGLGTVDLDKFVLCCGKYHPTTPTLASQGKLLEPICPVFSHLRDKVEGNTA